MTSIALTRIFIDNSLKLIIPLIASSHPNDSAVNYFSLYQIENIVKLYKVMLIVVFLRFLAVNNVKQKIFTPDNFLNRGLYPQKIK